MDDNDDNDNHDTQGQVEGVLSSTVKNKKLFLFHLPLYKKWGLLLPVLVYHDDNNDEMIMDGLTHRSGSIGG